MIQPSMRRAFATTLSCALVAILVLAAPACRRAKSSPAAAAIEARAATESSAREPAAREEVDPCVEATAPESGTRTIDSDGRSRSATIDFPTVDPAASPIAARPLLFAFHGWGGSPEQLERTTKIAETARARGFIVVRPSGVGRSFNAGTCCGDAAEAGVDDVAYVRRLVGVVAKETCVDRKRIYATGFSNGGFFAHRLGCEASDLVAAIASVSGTSDDDMLARCAPTRPVPVLHVHGARDKIVKFDGDDAHGWSSVAEVIAAWTRLNRCSLEGSMETFTHGHATCVRSGPCEGGAEVTLCRDERAGHTWPGGPKSFGYGGTQDLDATTTILDFFDRH